MNKNSSQKLFALLNLLESLSMPDGKQVKWANNAMNSCDRASQQNFDGGLCWHICCNIHLTDQMLHRAFCDER